MHGLLQRLHELEAVGVKVVLVGNGPPSAVAAFAREHALEHRVVLVTDPSLELFRAAGLVRPRVLGLRALWEMARAIGAGYAPRRISGDALQLGGAFLVDETGRIVYYHRANSPGDLADPSDIIEAALALRVEQRLGGRRV